MDKSIGIAILAGGAGRRMGSVNKAALPYFTGTFGEKIARELNKLGNTGFISAANYDMTGADLPGDWSIVDDSITGADGSFVGPIGGICSVLAEAGKKGLRGVFFVPCDMPRFRHEMTELLEIGDDEDRVVLWQTRDGRMHMACAFYPVAGLPVLMKAVENGNYRLRDAAALIGMRVVKAEDKHVPENFFVNINNPMEYGALMAADEEPPVLAVSGRKNTGKTTLLTKLVSGLAKRGVKCAVIKHDGHEFEADVPGTDSYKLKAAGACGTAIYSATKFCLVKDAEDLTEKDLTGYFRDADIIFLEGHKWADVKRFELLRKGVSEEPLCDPDTVIAYVSDMGSCNGKETVGFDDIDRLLELVTGFMDGGQNAGIHAF